MRIKLNLDSLAMMLFCARLKAYKEVPLTTDEWQMVEQTIRKKGLNGPASLLSMTRNELEDILEINEFIAYKMVKRLSTLNLFLSVLSNLENNGINITTKYEEDYPIRLVKHLKKRAPLYLFYCGNIENIKDGISLAGLTKVSKKDRTYTRKLVDKVIDNNLSYTYYITSITDLLLASTYNLHLSKKFILKCEYCGDLFIPKTNKKEQKYCYSKDEYGNYICRNKGRKNIWYRNKAQSNKSN